MWRGWNISRPVYMVVKSLQAFNSQLRLAVSLMVEPMGFNANIIIYDFVLSEHACMMKGVKITTVSPTIN